MTSRSPFERVRVVVAIEVVRSPLIMLVPRLLVTVANRPSAALLMTACWVTMARSPLLKVCVTWETEVLSAPDMIFVPRLVVTVASTPSAALLTIAS